MVSTRVVVGRARVVREVRAAGHLMAALAAAVPARAPWLTAVLNSAAARRLPGRPVAVVLEAGAQDRPEAAAFLWVRRSGVRTVVTLLGDAAGPVPDGRPAARLLARDDAAAGRLAAGLAGLLADLPGPWVLRLAGLPLGDPTLRSLADHLPPPVVVANRRSRRLIDGLDDLVGEPGRVLRVTDPVAVEAGLPAVLDREPDPARRGFLRAAVRLHAAIGQVELAVVRDGGPPVAGLLTLLDGADRWPWWGFGEGTTTEMGAPLVGLTASGPGRVLAGLLARAGVRPQPG